VVYSGKDILRKNKNNSTKQWSQPKEIIWEKNVLFL